MRCTLASIMEELINTLEQENEVYQQLIPISEEKTKIIVRNDLDELQKIVVKEQGMVEQINLLEKKREEVILNIGTVIGKDPKLLTVQVVSELLEKQPKEQRKLNEIHDNLKNTIQRLIKINNHNKSLIKQSLDMIEFNMNFIQSTRMLPGNNNYTKGASAVDTPVLQTGMFDAKQ